MEGKSDNIQYTYSLNENLKICLIEIFFNYYFSVNNDVYKFYDKTFSHRITAS